MFEVFRDVAVIIAIITGVLVISYVPYLDNAPWYTRLIGIFIIAVSFLFKVLATFLNLVINKNLCWI